MPLEISTEIRVTDHAISRYQRRIEAIHIYDARDEIIYGVSKLNKTDLENFSFNGKCWVGEITNSKGEKIKAYIGTKNHAHDVSITTVYTVCSYDQSKNYAWPGAKSKKQ